MKDGVSGATYVGGISGAGTYVVGCFNKGIIKGTR